MSSADIRTVDYELLSRLRKSPKDLFTPDELERGRDLFVAIWGKGASGKSCIKDMVIERDPDRAAILPLRMERDVRGAEIAKVHLIPTSPEEFDWAIAHEESADDYWTIVRLGMPNTPRSRRAAYSVSAIKRAIADGRKHFFIIQVPMFFALAEAFPGIRSFVITASEEDHRIFQEKRGLALSDSEGMNDYGFRSAGFEVPGAIKLVNELGRPELVVDRINEYIWGDQK